MSAASLEADQSMSGDIQQEDVLHSHHFFFEHLHFPPAPFSDALNLMSALFGSSYLWDSMCTSDSMTPCAPQTP